jgi:hypothetical protein
MTKYQSRYRELGFYVNGELRRFTASEYRTDSADEIAVLESLTDANKLEDESTEEPVKPTPKPRKATKTSE